MDNLSLKKDALIKENEELRDQFNRAQHLINEINNKIFANKSKLELIEELEELKNGKQDI